MSEFHKQEKKQKKTALFIHVNKAGNQDAESNLKGETVGMTSGCLF